MSPLEARYALTLTQPWATLMACGAKRVETRSWKPPDWLVGELVLIHAGKGLGPLRELGVPGTERGLLEVLDREPYYGALKRHGYLSQAHVGLMERPPIDRTRIPLGAIVAVGRLTKVVPTEYAEQVLQRTEAGFQEIRLGDYTPGRWAWRFRDIQPFGPVECGGGRKVWTLSPAVAAEVERLTS